jgi:hypothetical protein
MARWDRDRDLGGRRQREVSRVDGPCRQGGLGWKCVGGSWASAALEYLRWTWACNGILIGFDPLSAKSNPIQYNLFPFYHPARFRIYYLLLLLLDAST